MRAILMTVAMLACSSNIATPVDGSVPAGASGCPPLPDRASFDFYGETCIPLPYPVNTTCHVDDSGWCIDGICRPMSSRTPQAHCPSCPPGAERFAPAGAGYCAP